MQIRCQAAERRFDLVTTDVDGTLLNSKNELSPRNEEAIAQCIKLGIPVGLRQSPSLHYSLYCFIVRQARVGDPCASEALHTGVHCNWESKGALVQEGVTQDGEAHARSIHAGSPDLQCRWHHYA